jgi:ligand-binding SRPBCC domain-containing protein
MDTVRSEIWIDAPVERCFLLSLSVDLHIASARASREQAVDGIATGLISEGETVTFQGRHLGFKLKHTTRIEALRPYSHFRGMMTAGIFEYFEHNHHFAAMNDGTRIRDEIRFLAPWGMVGQLVTSIFVRRHLLELLMKRNAEIKQVAESEEWHHYLDGRSTTTMVLRQGDTKASGWGGDGALRGSRS